MIPIMAALKVVGACKAIYDIYHKVIEDPTKGDLGPIEQVDMVAAREHMKKLRNMLNELDLDEEETAPVEEKKEEPEVPPAE